jgi:predicted amino acid-binding ACT domain protein
MAEPGKNTQLSVQITVIGLDEPGAVRAAEVLSRAQIGLALEGYSVTLMVMTFETEPE